MFELFANYILYFISRFKKQISKQKLNNSHLQTISKSLTSSQRKYGEQE